jgi:hypothetical protein
MTNRVRTIPAWLGWAPLAIVAVEIVVTYSRLPAHELYHVSGTGIDAGLGRALVFLNFPVALAALPLIALAAERLRERWWAVPTAIVACLLCAVVVWPGVVDQADLDAKPINAVAAAGVALALVFLAAARVFTVPACLDLGLAAGVVLLLLIALPWIAAELGFYLDGVPVLGWVFLTGKVVAGHPAVHHGHHHGMDGVLLVLAALATIPLLRGARGQTLRAAVGIYLGLQIAYGLANTANDGWGEQIVKRGWTEHTIPAVLRPAFSLAWLGIVVAAAAFSILVRRRAARWVQPERSASSPASPRRSTRGEAGPPTSPPDSASSSRRRSRCRACSRTRASRRRRRRRPSAGRSGRTRTPSRCRASFP